ncbi:interleukin-6 receptor subunit alpha isoform X2 [Bufo bufo]|uniref:interleukin-6 receptor subunit alpha isoform X2 n=1 Tax=Bufo bufo TaxID=8384 RepID=UPI001ABE5FF5|nr:interleukin-6 receptor subunit alpha isoform X2 [Bufo bufo]
MVGFTGGWSMLIVVLCSGRFATSNTAETLCPKPAVPEDAVLVTLLSDVSLTCAGCAGRVSWSRPSSHRATRPLNVTEGGHLALHSVTYEDEDNYTCYKDGAPACSVELMVKDGRHKDTSLSCYHRHPTHNITCEWRPTGQLHPSSTVYLIKVRMLEEPTFYPCTYNRSSAAFSCSSLYREGDSSRHVFYLCVSGRTDSELSANLEARVEDLLHVAPPLNVRVTPVEHRPRRLRVSWSLPEFWENPFYGLVYQVLYRVENSPHQSNGTTTEMSFIIHDALMGRRHLIQVRAREEYQKNWGSWSEEAVGVPWSDGATTTLVPFKYDHPTSQDEEDPLDEDEVRPVTRIFWIAACVSLGLVILFVLGLCIRFQEMKFLKLQWGVLRSLLHLSSAQPPATESALMSSPSSVVVTFPPLLDGE